MVTCSGSPGSAAPRKIHPFLPALQVAAVPGPPILTWYHVVPSAIQPREERRERLHSGDDYTISIDEYRDGAQDFSLHIPSVRPEHLEGSFRCEARNDLGTDGLNIALAEAAEVVDFDDENWTFVKNTESLRETGSSSASPSSSSAAKNQRISGAVLAAYLAVIVVRASVALAGRV